MVQLPSASPLPLFPPLHTEGSKLWGIYRGYELSLLEAQPSEEQAERVRGLWTRQLAVPLADGPDSLTAYEAWERSRPGERSCLQGGSGMGGQVASIKLSSGWGWE